MKILKMLECAILLGMLVCVSPIETNAQQLGAYQVLGNPSAVQRTATATAISTPMLPLGPVGTTYPTVNKIPYFDASGHINLNANMYFAIANPALGDAGDYLDGGIIDHFVTGNLQVGAYHLRCTTGTQPTYGPCGEFIIIGTQDPVTNFNRQSWTAMALWADPGFNNPADDWRLQLESGGTSLRKPFRISSQTNTGADAGYQVRFMTFGMRPQVTGVVSAVAADGNVQFFEYIDAPAPKASSLSIVLRQDRYNNAPVLTGAGHEDSPAIIFGGPAFDTSLHYAYWKLVAHPTTNAGVSTFQICNQIDSAGYTCIFQVQDTGAGSITGNFTVASLTILGSGSGGATVVCLATCGNPTVTIAGTASISGTNTGDVTFAGGGQNYLSITNQVITVGAVDLSGTHVTGTLASARVSGSYTGITGVGTLTAGATGAGFTVALATSTISGTLPSANVSGSYTGITGVGALAAGSLATGFTVVGPALGGTGVANNASSTITISGNFATTFTVANTTNSTLPAGTHTLAGLDVAQTWTAVQTFTNSDIALLGSSTGKTTFTSDNAGASNFTMHVPALNSTLVTQGDTNTVANSVLGTMTNGTIKCRTTAGTGSPDDCSWTQVSAFSTTPTVKTCASGLTCNGGAQTYTTTSGVRWLRISLQATGGGGGGSNLAGAGGDGAAGSNSTFSTSSGTPSLSFTVAGGGGGLGNTDRGIGGSVTETTGTCNIRNLSGGTGQGGNATAAAGLAGAMGGTSFSGGTGAGGYAAIGGSAASARSGSGGGGAGINGIGNTGGGGGAGAYCEFLIAPSAGAVFNYNVPTAGGAGGSAGASGFAGGAGGSPNMRVEEYYNFLLKRDLAPAANDNTPMWLNAAA